MEDLKLKLRVVYFPFLFVAVGTIALYNFLRWFLDIQLDVLPLRDDLLDFWLPCSLPWIPVLIWLRRRIRILNVNGKHDNGYFGYQFAMVGAIAVPLIISQTYITTASFGLVEVDTVQAIQDISQEKYFKFRSFDVDKEAALPHINARTSGRYESNLTFYLYVAVPFQNTSNVWYGVDYQQQINNNSSDAVKEEAYQAFIQDSDSSFAQYDFQAVTYFEKLGLSDDQKGFLKAIEVDSSTTNPSQATILIPHTTVFEERLGNTLPWIFGSFGIGALIILIMIVIPKIHAEEWEAFMDNQSLQEDDLKEFLSYLDPRGATPAATTLLLLNLAVFIIMVLYGMNLVSPTPGELLDLGGNRRSEVLEGDYWRLFTAIFIHSGLSHLFMNLIVLGAAGAFLENIIGKTKLVISFLICGLLASVASIAWYENTVSVGASGAIFGWLGIILTFVLFKIYPETARDFAKLLLGFVIGSSIVFSFFDNVDNAGHLGGLASGFIFGSILVFLQRSELTTQAYENEFGEFPDP